MDIGTHLILMIGVSRRLGHSRIRDTLNDYLRIPKDHPLWPVVEFLRDVTNDGGIVERMEQKWDLGYLDGIIADATDSCLKDERQ